MSDLTLYTYFLSSCAYRVRIALTLKGIDYQSRFIHLSKDGGENWKPDYLQINPQGLVPSLVDGRHLLTQSLAIIEYLEEGYPDPALLPADIYDRARVRALSQAIGSDIQPLNNSRVLGYLRHELAVDEQAIKSWNCHWIAEGFAAIEKMLVKHGSSGRFCLGEQVTMADVCLIPQVYNATRYQCELSAYPVIGQIYRHCLSLPAFQAAVPEHQQDAE